jgi:hypothetical protein
MSQNIPFHLLCDDLLLLLLLIGTNTLPNWVAAQLLINILGRFVMIETGNKPPVL